ncbi:MAG: phosphoadenosine phosphosulfate reductase family protein [Bacteroidales bacterium]
MNKIENANMIIGKVSQKEKSVILFCSLGKDSLVLLDLMAPKFDKILCVFMYFVPNLDHINRYINWAKTKYPNVVFEQVPHWNLSHILRAGLYCVLNPNIKLITIKDVNHNIQLKYGLKYSFYGMKKADSINRRLMLNTYSESYYINNGNVYPLAEWTQRDILAYMKMKKLPEPVRYSKNASGGLGFNLDCYLWMQKNAPQDLRKVLKAFPLSEKILFDYGNK